MDAIATGYCAFPGCYYGPDAAPHLRRYLDLIHDASRRAVPPVQAARRGGEALATSRGRRGEQTGIPRTRPRWSSPRALRLAFTLGQAAQGMRRRRSDVAVARIAQASRRRLDGRGEGRVGQVLDESHPVERRRINPGEMGGALSARYAKALMGTNGLRLIGIITAA